VPTRLLIGLAHDPGFDDHGRDWDRVKFDLHGSRPSQERFEIAVGLGNRLVAGAQSADCMRPDLVENHLTGR
jgi:hypothetical protein